MKPYTLKQLLGMVLVLAIGTAVLISCTGCADLSRAQLGGVKTPEPWRADAKTPEGKLNGAVREFCYMHKSYWPIMDNNMTVIWNDPDWDEIAKKAKAAKEAKEAEAQNKK